MTALASRLGIASLLLVASVVPTSAQVDARVRASVRVGPVRGRVVVRTPDRVDHRRYRHDAPRYRDRIAGPVYVRSTYRNPRRAPVRARVPRACRDGRGNIASGWRWCVERGFVHPQYQGGAWEASFTERVHFREHRRRGVGRVNANRLRRILGRYAFAEVDAHRHRIGAYGRLHAEWMALPYGGEALVVFAGGAAIAEFHDRDRDAYVDVTFYYL